MQNDHKVTAELVRSLFDYDPSTGELRYLLRRGRRSAGAAAGTRKPTGYIIISINGLFFQAARVVCLHYYGQWPIHSVDHINHIRDDNRIENLRDVTHGKNMHNQSTLRRNNTSGWVGVSHHKKKNIYAATISVNGKSIFLGEFRDLDSAIQARKRGKAAHHGLPT